MNSVQSVSFPKLPGLRIPIFVFLLYVSVSSDAFAQKDSRQYINKLSSEFRNSSNDSSRIEKLSELAFYYYDYLADKHSADSISQVGIDIAEASYRPGLLLLAYNRYIESNDLGTYSVKAMRFAIEAVKLSKLANNPQLEWHSYSNLIKVYQAAYLYDKALDNSYQALALSDATADETLKAESYLLIGQCLEGENQKIEAFRNYLNATSLAEQMQEISLLKKCYSQLSAFYNHNKIFDKALIYKLRQVDLITRSKVVDSVDLMWAQYDLQAININSNNNKLNTKSIQEVFDFASRNNNIRLKNYEIALYRSHLIEADKISQVIALYKNQYPKEFNKLSTENPSLFYRLKAYFNEENNKPDSAYYNLSKAEQLIQTDPNKILKSNFYHRFGQFLVRQGKPAEAAEKFLKAYDLAHEASYLTYMLSASKSLEDLYSSQGDYRNAYTYSALTRSLTDSLNLLSKNDELLTMEIEHEARQRELAAELEHNETHRRHNIQYTAITIIIIAMFILLMMLGSLKVPAWTIKMLGFFSFILFFEFIIMIADHKIYEITANEPWKILLIKIGLIAFLLPFHHWIEKKVIHFLIEKKIINIPRFSIQRILQTRLQKNRKQAETTE